MDKEFDPHNFCVYLKEPHEFIGFYKMMSALTQELIMESFNPDEPGYYAGFRDGRLIKSSIPFATEFELQDLAVIIVKFKVNKLLEEANENKRWFPFLGERVLASKLGNNFSEVLYCFKADDWYYCINPTTIEEAKLNNKREISLSKYKHIKPVKI